MNKRKLIDDIEKKTKAKFVKVILGDDSTDVDRLLKQVDNAEVCLSCNKSECDGDLNCFRERRQRMRKRTENEPRQNTIN